MGKLFGIFRIKRGEALPAAVAAVAALALNAFFVYKMYGVLTPPGNAAKLQRHIFNYFYISGYDPITLVTVSSWTDLYNVQRHPLLAFLISPLSLLNAGLTPLTGLNCALFITAALMAACAFYSLVFLRRTLTEVIGLGPLDANLLTTLFFSFGYVMVITFTPDHFGFSMCMLLIVLYVAGMRMKKRKIVPTWQMAVLYVFATGITTTNSVKTVLMQLAVNGRKFFRPSNILVGIVVPSVALWMFCKFEYDTFVAPIDKARHEARVKKRAAQKAQEEKMRRLYAEADSAMRARMAPKMKKKRVVSKQGRPLSNEGMLRWSDVTTPRWPSLVENVFGEPLLFHRRHLLGDALRHRPVFVEYDIKANYFVEAAVVLLFLAGIACGIRSRLLWLALSWFGFDMALHLGLGFGINEVYIMSPHWLFVLPVAMAFIFRRARGWRLAALRAVVACLAAYMLAHNGWLLCRFMLTPVG